MTRSIGTTAPAKLSLASPVHRRSVGTLAAIAGLGGALLFTDLALQAFRGLGPFYFVMAGLMAFCFPALPLAYIVRRAIAPGWRAIPGGLGLILVITGAGAWLTAFVLLFSHPEAAFTQHLTPGGSLLMALGMILFGASVLASGRLAGFGAVAPLAVGLYFPLQLVAQLTFFLQGKDDAPGPNGFLLGSWGLIWIWAAWNAVRLRSRVS